LTNILPLTLGSSILVRLIMRSDCIEDNVYVVRLSYAELLSVAEGLNYLTTSVERNDIIIFSEYYVPSIEQEEDLLDDYSVRLTAYDLNIICLGRFAAFNMRNLGFSLFIGQEDASIFIQ